MPIAIRDDGIKRAFHICCLNGAFYSITHPGIDVQAAGKYRLCRAVCRLLWVNNCDYLWLT